MARYFRRIRTIAFWGAILAVLPYVVLKVSWLGGSTIGLRDGDTSELHSTRMVTGNIVTIGLELVAVALALALTRPWGRRVPGWVFFVLGTGATGLLAPMIIGLPMGVLLQLPVQHTVSSGSEGNLESWVFAIVYTGFVLLGVALSVLFGLYVVGRWGHILTQPPDAPSIPVAIVGAVGVVPFGAAMVWWSLCGPGTAGPQGMNSIAQRTVLAVTGLLVLSALLAPLHRRTNHPHLIWLITWVGCTSAVMQGPAHLLLARGGHPQPAVAILGGAATVAGSLYILALLRSTYRRHSSSPESLPSEPVSPLTTTGTMGG